MEAAARDLRNGSALFTEQGTIRWSAHQELLIPPNRESSKLLAPRVERFEQRRGTLSRRCLRCLWIANVLEAAPPARSTVSERTGCQLVDRVRWGGATRCAAAGTAHSKQQR